MPLHLKRPPHKRMRRLDDHHLERHGSTQLTQSGRFFVIHRKLSLGTSSKNGERFVERAQSAAATCRLHGRSLFAYHRELLVAHNRGDPFPALT